jgi:hypothetical protein
MDESALDFGHGLVGGSLHNHPAANRFSQVVANLATTVSRSHRRHVRGTSAGLAEYRVARLDSGCSQVDAGNGWLRDRGLSIFRDNLISTGAKTLDDEGSASKKR